MIRFAPNGDRVVIRPLSEAEVRKSSVSIIIPGGQSKEAAQHGIILSVGPETTYKVGEKVLFNPMAGDRLKVPGKDGMEELRIVHADTILATIHETA